MHGTDRRVACNRLVLRRDARSNYRNGMAMVTDRSSEIRAHISGFVSARTAQEDPSPVASNTSQVAHASSAFTQVSSGSNR